MKNKNLLKISLPLFFLMVCFTNLLNAQCLNATYGQYPGTTFTPTCNGTNQTITAIAYGSEYSLVNVVSGNQYTFSSSAAIPYITISNNAGTLAYAFGNTPVVWVASFTGVARFYTHTSAACGGITGSYSRIVSCTTPPPAGCTNTFSYAIFNAPLTGAPYTIDLCQWAGDYNTMNNTPAATNFTAGTDIAGTYITVHSGTYNGPVVAAGVTPLTWTSGAAGSYFIHYNTSIACGTANVCMISTITNNSAPIPVTANACAPVAIASSQRSFDGCALRVGNDRTFQVTIPVAGSWTFSLCGGAAWDSYMYLSSALCASQLALSDDACGLLSEITYAIPAAGTYYIDVEPFGAAAGNAFTLTISRNDPLPTATATASPATTLCSGNLLTLTGSGAGTGVVYLWAGPQAATNGVPFAATTSGTYTVTATDVGGCTSTSIVAITVNPLPPVTASASPNPVCPGGTTTLTGGGAATYVWAGPQPVTNGVPFTPAASGTYTVTGTSAAGCSSTSSITVNIAPLPVVTATATPNPVCNGANTTLTGGGAATYAWAGPQVVTDGVPFMPAATGSYTVTGTSAAGCTSTSSVAVTLLPVMTTSITQNPTGLLCGVDPTLTAVSTGGGITVAPAPGTRYYVRDGEPWAWIGFNHNIDAMDAVFGLGNYTALDYASANPVTVFVPGTQFVFLEGSDNNGPALESYLAANLTVIENWVAAGGRLFMNCAKQGGGNFSMGFGGTTLVYPDFTNTANYVPHPVLNGPFLPTANSISGTSYGHATLTNGGTVIASGPNAVLTEKTWGNGMVLFGGITNTAFHTPFAESQNVWKNILNYNANAPAAVPYTYSWMPGGATTPSITATTTGVYTVTVTSPAGCTSSATISVTINPAVVTTASASPSTICEGESTTITASGGTTFDWQPGNLTGPVQILSPAANTTYTVTGSDPSGCTSVTTVDVTVNPTPTISGTTATPGTICEGSSSQLQTVPGSNPDNYIVNSIPYAPVVPSGPAFPGPGGDDNTSAPIPIGFPFTFYGSTYTDFVISTNGFISFDPFVYNGCCQGEIIPSPFSSTNLVALAWNDLNPSAGGSISYYNLTSPNRMVIEFNGVVQYGGGGGPLTGQIILYDNGNIETHTATVLSDPFDAQTLGVQNLIGTFATAAPGRNGTAWGATNESWLFTPDVATVTWSPAGSLNNATIVNPLATPSGTTTYTVTASTAVGCTATQTVEVIVNPAPVVSASATPNTTCNNTSVTPSGTGPNLVWSGGLIDGTPFIATATNTYTVTGTDGIGCSATSTVTVTVNPASGILAPATSNQSQNHGDDFDIDYYDGSCDLIATVDDGNGGNVLGLTTSTVNVDATANFHNGQPFVRRWYQITPSSNGSADVVIYINQTDFDDYNSVVLPPYLMMPTSGNNGDPNIPNIRITKNDDAGLGNNPIVITPAVNWNGNYWELSFNTLSFSQFRVHSVNPGNVPLPVVLTNFDGKKLESTDELTWTTGSEQNNAYFNLQHSTDGVNFATIAKVNSKALNGNSATSLNYNAINSHPALGHNYYRLQQVDIDNKASIHAKIVDLIWGANGSTVNIYPNPTRDILNIDLYTTKVQNTTVKVLDMSGRTIKQVQAKSVAGMNNITISLGEFASGLYTVQVYENDKLMQTGKVRKND